MTHAKIDMPKEEFDRLMYVGDAEFDSSCDNNDGNDKKLGCAVCEHSIDCRGECEGSDDGSPCGSFLLATNCHGGLDPETGDFIEGPEDDETLTG